MSRPEISRINICSPTAMAMTIHLYIYKWDKTSLITCHMCFGCLPFSVWTLHVWLIKFNLFITQLILATRTKNSWLSIIVIVRDGKRSTWEWILRTYKLDGWIICMATRYWTALNGTKVYQLPSNRLACPNSIPCWIPCIGDSIFWWHPTFEYQKKH